MAVTSLQARRPGDRNHSVHYRARAAQAVEFALDAISRGDLLAASGFAEEAYSSSSSLAVSSRPSSGTEAHEKWPMPKSASRYWRQDARPILRVGTVDRDRVVLKRARGEEEIIAAHVWDIREEPL